MLAGRPGARSAVAELAAEPLERGRAVVVPRWSGSRQRPAGGAQLDMKIHLEKNLEEERQILLQQQKICRSRARRYFVESNRRKKAFEEKRKEQEEKEHQIREQILQQRKQKFEEVTERFQRAHIPLSQRRRAVYQRSVPPLDEALRQIQDSSLKSEVTLPSSHRPTINWRAVDNALPSSLVKNDHKHQKPLLSNFNCGKEMKENSRENLATNKYVFQLKLEETQKLLEDQHLSSLQKFCHEVNQITNSETLSSADSLEAGGREEPYFLLNREPPSTSVPKNSGSSDSANLQSTHLRCFQDKLSFSKAQHINNWLTNLDDPSVQNDIPFSDVSSQPNVLPSEESFSSKGNHPCAPNRTRERTMVPADSSLSFVCSSPLYVQDNKKSTSETSNTKTASSSSGAFKMETPLVTKSPNLKLRKAWTTADSLPKEVTALSDQEKYSELTQGHRSPSPVPAAMPSVLPSDTKSARPLPKKSGHMKEINTGQCSFKLGELKDDKEEKKYFHSYKQELPLFSDIFQATCIPHNSDSKDDQKIAGTLSNVISDYDSVGQHKKTKYSIHERSGMRFLKSILKKDSKYEHDYLKSLVLNQGFKLGNKKAAAIRDSIELTKERGKSMEIPKTIKKLRWFDETGNTEKYAEGNDSLKNRIDISPVSSQPSYTYDTVSGSAANVVRVPACAPSSADVKKPKDNSALENVTALEGFGTDQVPLKCFFPSGYNFAKQSWLTPKKEESKSPAQNGDSGTQKAADLKRRGAKVIRKTRSAKVQSGFLCSNRKGVIFRPQSASKANKFLQAQSKLIIPHPPSQPPSNIRSGEALQVSQCQSRMPEDSQNVAAYNCFNSKHVLPAEQELSQWNQKSGLPFADVCSDFVSVMPSLSCSKCQSSAIRNHLHGTQKGTQPDAALCCTHKHPGYEESQETANLWKRQHDILGQKEKAAESPVTRRKQMTENKQRILLEQERQDLGSAEQKFRGQISKVGQTIQLSSSEPKQATRGISRIEQVSESTSEFLMAENLVKASMAEDEILTLLNSKQEQKPAPNMSGMRQFDLCTLSAEEQKVLQSLDRLNERLHYLQEIICKNPSIKNTLKIIPALDSHPTASLSPDVGSRLQREY